LQGLLGWGLLFRRSQEALMERLLSPAEIAEWLGVPLPSIYRWRYERRGPVGIKCGRHVRYDPAEVRRWLAEHRDDRA